MLYKYTPKRMNSFKLEGRKRKIHLVKDAAKYQKLEATEISPINVISSFQTEQRLYRNIPDVIEMTEIAVVINSTQANTERTVKVLGDLANHRFEGAFNEIKESAGKRDRVEQETIIKKLDIPLENLPHKKLKKEFYRRHLAAIQKKSPTALSSTLKNMINATPKYTFTEKWKNL